MLVYWNGAPAVIHALTAAWNPVVDVYLPPVCEHEPKILQTSGEPLAFPAIT
jgi:hypothetical protein